MGIMAMLMKAPVIGSVVSATGLVAYWKMDEASGSRLDGVGTTTLADNGTVTSVTGVQGSAAHFASASSQFLSASSNSALQTSATVGRTFALWVYLDNITDSFDFLLQKGGGSNGTNEYLLYYQASNGHFNWQVVSPGSSASIVQFPTILSAATWYFLALFVDPANQQVGISVNNGTTIWQTNLTSGPRVGAGEFSVGGAWDGSAFSNSRIDEFGIWQRLISDAERAALYNGGAGTTYPF